MALFRMKPHYRKRGGTLSYYGTATPLSIARNSLAATTVGNYALFGGGYMNNVNGTYGDSSTVDAYDSSLTHYSAPELQYTPGARLVAATVGDYAIFYGGHSSYSPKYVYNSSLTRTYLGNANRYGLAATSIGNYAIFGGGIVQNSGAITSIVNAIDSSLTAVSVPYGLIGSGSYYAYLAATSIGNYALFGGGTEGSNYCSAYIIAYDSSLSRVYENSDGLSKERCNLAATSVGNYALFGGGKWYQYYSSYSSDIIDVYDTALVKNTPISLSTSRYDLSATTVKDFALFGSGQFYSGDGGQMLKIVDGYDKTLVHVMADELPVFVVYNAATSIGNYALFGGGINSTSINTVYVYQVT